MWIQMKKDYRNGLDLFPAGEKFDLPENTLGSIPRRHYQVCCAPWDETKDTVADRLSTAMARCSEAGKRRDALAGQAKDLEEAAAELDKEAGIKSEQAKKSRDSLARIAAAKAAARAAIAHADLDMAKIEIKAVTEDFNTAIKEIDTIKAEIAEAIREEQNEDSSEQTKPDTAVNDTGKQAKQDDTDTKGQAAKSGK